MNKDKLVDYVKKNKWSILSGVGFVIGGYFLLHTNFSYHLEDRTGKYILNPEYKEFHKYEWTDLKTVYPTKLAYDSSWFKLPPDKYIPKEQPIPKEITSISDPIIRRQAYFNFLCKSEGVLYHTESTKNIKFPNKDGFLDLNVYYFPKVNNYSKNNEQDIILHADGNPFISPIYSKSNNFLTPNQSYNFYYAKESNSSKVIWSNNQEHNSFLEVLSPSGQFYEIKYDLYNKQFLPLKSIDKSFARYYGLRRPINNLVMKNLGIDGFEGIVFDREKNKLITYGKLFYMGTILPWQKNKSISNFSWAKLNSCGTKPNIIENF